MLAVIDLLLALSPSSAEVERGFTQMKLVKTDRRNCLKGTTLNMLLGIKFLTSTIKEYDPKGITLSKPGKVFSNYMISCFIHKVKQYLNFECML